LRLGQGRENVKTFLRDNPEGLEELRAKILAKHGLAGESESTEEGKEEAKKEKAEA